MFRLSVVLIILLSAYQLRAFTIHGTVRDNHNEKLPYTNIYVKGTSNGTSANAEGEYHLDLPAGNYDIVFEHLGCQQHIETVNLQKNTELNIALQEVEYQLHDAVINGNEDPAIAVIRKAIERRKYFLNAVQSYSCDAYVKGLERILEAPDKILGRKINRTGILTGPNNSGILYLSESKSKLYYQKPNKFHEVVYSSKVSGNSNGFTFNSAQDFYFNFYERTITIPFIAQRPFISPLSENAFFYYNYKMLGAYQEGDRLINKIQVTPKRKSDPCFSGILNIVEDNWNIHSLELYLNKNNGIQYVDTLKVTQYFIPIKDDLWLPSQQRYDAKAGFLGIKGDGYYLGIFSNYQLNNLFGAKPPVIKVDSTKAPKKFLQQKKKEEKKAEKKIFTPEVLKVEADANKRDSTYWDSIRPIPLTSFELQDYQMKDSIQLIRDTKVFKDSTDKALNKPGPLTILLGYTYVKQYKKIYISFPSLFNLINFNTVEGVDLRLRFGVPKTFDKRRSLSVSPTVRYGIHNRQFNAMASVVYTNSVIHREFITLSGGRYISQINNEQPQTEFGNTWQSLVFKNNFMKIYEAYFLRASYAREIYNGIDGHIMLSYERRSPLVNTDTFSFFPKEKNEYTANGVALPGVDNENITAHNVMTLDLRFNFTFASTYVSRPDMRFRMDSKYPQITLHYKKGIPVKGVSDQNFDMLEGSIFGNIPMKLLGTMFYSFGGGGFPNHTAIDYPDYKHFYGNFLNTGGSNLLGFYLIQYYRNSTDLYFTEAHIEHHFGGFIFNKIPGIRKLKLDEVLGFHFLYTPTRKEYFQINAGIANIAKVLRIDFVAGFLGGNVYHYGARIALPFYFGN